MKNSSTAGASSKNNETDAMVADAASGVAREFHNFVADIEDLLKATTTLTGDDLQKVKDQLNERIAAAKDSAAEISETVVNRARKTAETTNTYVHEQPWNAVGIGAAVGLFVGYLLARRN